MEQRKKIFTDGACSGNPGPGGWAWIMEGGNFSSGNEKQTTNQRMELTAAYQAAPAGKEEVPAMFSARYCKASGQERRIEGLEPFPGMGFVYALTPATSQT